MNKAFTLGRLVVVILIVGVLFVFGLSQYQKMVGKARVAETKANLDRLDEEGILHYLETGRAPTEEDVSYFARNFANAADWEYGMDECCASLNGDIGCSWYATYKKDGLTEIHYSDSDYNRTCGDAAVFIGYYCVKGSEGGKAGDCEQFGFSITSDNEIYYETF